MLKLYQLGYLLKHCDCDLESYVQNRPAGAFSFFGLLIVELLNLFETSYNAKLTWTTFYKTVTKAVDSSYISLTIESK